MAADKKHNTTQDDQPSPASMKAFLSSIHAEGHLFVALFVVASLLLFLLAEPLGWIGLVLTAWCLYFFRDPERVIPDAPGIMVSPADGVVSGLQEVAYPPELLGDDKDAPSTVQRLSIFLNVFNVHVNRSPVAGEVRKLVYVPGEFVNAGDPDASVLNERQLVEMTTAEGDRMAYAQVAGLIARRIICDLSEGQKIARGDRMGIIRFGSRTDIYLPAHWDIKVQVGQTMVGGETVIAQRQS